MKEEILDFRSFLSVVLVALSLIGQEWSPLYDDKSDTQNLTFIPPLHHQNVRSKLDNIESDNDLLYSADGLEKYMTNVRY